MHGHWSKAMAWRWEGGLLLGGNSDLGKSMSVMKLPIPTCTASMSTQQTGVLSPTSNK